MRKKLSRSSQSGTVEMILTAPCDVAPERGDREPVPVKAGYSPEQFSVPEGKPTA